MAYRNIAADTPSGDADIIVQGFRGGEGLVGPYVFLGIQDDGMLMELSLSPEHANMLGEYLRQEAEYAQTVREENE